MGSVTVHQRHVLLTHSFIFVDDKEWAIALCEVSLVISSYFLLHSQPPCKTKLSGSWFLYGGEIITITPAGLDSVGGNKGPQRPSTSRKCHVSHFNVVLW